MKILNNIQYQNSNIQINYSTLHLNYLKWDYTEI
jgi:hypothetical protein